MASSAMKAVWGEGGDTTSEESHREPISGATGQVSKGEPYDAGNLDDEAQRKKEEELARDNNAIGSAKQGPTDDFNSHHDPPQSLGSDTAPKEQVPESQDHHPQQQQQAASEPHRPVEESKPQAQTHHDPNLQDKGKAPTQPPTEAEAAAAAAMKNEDAKQKHKEDAHGSSGEHYVKTTGLAADGGDFDATKPGAGREAERLMHEKGMRHEDEGKKAGDAQASHRHGKDKDKPSFGERIKNKFHKH